MIAVALNTNFYYQGNKLFSSLSESDPGKQFAYLENLLQGARQSNTKVGIRSIVFRNHPKKFSVKLLDATEWK